MISAKRISGPGQDFSTMNNASLGSRGGVRPEGVVPSSRPFHVPIVPMSVKVPVAVSMLYIETLFEPEFVT